MPERAGAPGPPPPAAHSAGRSAFACPVSGAVGQGDGGAAQGGGAAAHVSRGGGCKARRAHVSGAVGPPVDRGENPSCPPPPSAAGQPRHPLQVLNGVHHSGPGAEAPAGVARPTEGPSAQAGRFAPSLAGEGGAGVLPAGARGAPRPPSPGPDSPTHIMASGASASAPQVTTWQPAHTVPLLTAGPGTTLPFLGVPQTAPPAPLGAGPFGVYFGAPVLYNGPRFGVGVGGGMAPYWPPPAGWVVDGGGRAEWAGTQITPPGVSPLAAASWCWPRAPPGATCQPVAPHPFQHAPAWGAWSPRMAPHGGPGASPAAYTGAMQQWIGHCVAAGAAAGMVAAAAAAAAVAAGPGRGGGDTPRGIKRPAVGQPDGEGGAPLEPQPPPQPQLQPAAPSSVSWGVSGSHPEDAAAHLTLPAPEWAAQPAGAGTTAVALPTSRSPALSESHTGRTGRRGRAGAAAAAATTPRADPRSRSRSLGDCAEAVGGKSLGSAPPRLPCPYAGQGCRFTARTASVIAVHLRTHTGERPYACRFCNYTAAQVRGGGRGKARGWCGGVRAMRADGVRGARGVRGGGVRARVWRGGRGCFYLPSRVCSTLRAHADFRRGHMLARTALSSTPAPCPRTATHARTRTHAHSRAHASDAHRPLPPWRVCVPCPRPIQARQCERARR